MKTTLTISLCILITITACNSTKSLELENPFITKKATYQKWLGGQKGMQGVKILISATETKKDCKYHTIYYLDRNAKIFTKKENTSLVLTATINQSKKGRQYSIDRKEEYGNEAPVKPKYPNLKENEAIVAYTQKGIEKHVKVILIKNGTILYP